MSADVTPLALHEGAHLAAAVLLGVPVWRASIAPGRACVELARPEVLAQTAAGIRRGALIAAAGPAADLRFDARGLKGYDLSDAGNDLAKLAALAVASDHLYGRPLDAVAVLREAEWIVRDFSPLVCEAADLLARFETLDAPILAHVTGRYGGLLAARYSEGQALCRT